MFFWTTGSPSQSILWTAACVEHCFAKLRVNVAMLPAWLIFICALIFKKKGKKLFTKNFSHVLHNMSDVVVLPGGGRKGFSGATKAKFVEGAAARATVICGQLTYAPAAYNTPRMSG
jgi:hypothetical protein